MNRPFSLLFSLSELQTARDRKATANRVIRRRVGVAAVVSGRTGRVTNHRRLLVEDVVSVQRQVEILHHADTGREVEIVIRLDFVEVVALAYERAQTSDRAIEQGAVSSGEAAGNEIIGGAFILHLVDIAPQKRDIYVTERQCRALIERELRLNRCAVRAEVAYAIAIIRCARSLERRRVRPVTLEVQRQVRKAHITLIVDDEVNTIGFQTTVVRQRLRQTQDGRCWR